MSDEKDKEEQQSAWASLMRLLPSRILTSARDIDQKSNDIRDRVKERRERISGTKERGRRN